MQLLITNVEDLEFETIMKKKVLIPLEMAAKDCSSTPSD